MKPAHRACARPGRRAAAAALALLAGSSALAAQKPAAECPWTIFVYGAADNNADGPLLEFLDGVRAAIDDDPGIELLLFIDRHEKYSHDAQSLGADFTGARVYRLRRDSAELLDASEEFPGMSADEEYETDSADPDNIGRFVAFGKRHFPARRYGLLIYSHADGCTMCPDEESGRSMSIPELTDVVGKSASVDFLALELCNMGGIEIAYQWRPGNGRFSAQVLVAIPNAGPPLDWDRAFARIRSQGHATQAEGPSLDPEAMTAEDFGKLVIEEGFRGRAALAERFPGQAERVQHESAACYDLGAAAAVKKAVDALAVALARSDARETFEELRGPGPAGTVMNYVGDEFLARPYVDLYDLGRRAAACPKLGEDARAAARSVQEAVDRCVLASFGMDGYAGFEPGKNGVFIVFPGGDAAGKGAPRRAWQRLDWYTPLAGSGEKAPYGRWAFLGDGATAANGVVENWFELLDCWFDDASGDPDGLNGYRW